MTARAKAIFDNNLFEGMKSIAVAAALYLSFQFTSVDALAQSNQASPLGTNLNGVNYYTVEQPFLNIFKVAASWVTRTYNGSTTGEEALLYSSFLDANGYPTTLTGGPAHNFNEVSALIYQGPGINYPSGQYLFIYDGTGTFSFGFDAATVSSSPGRIILNVNATTGGILAILTSTDPTNYARNFRLVYCGTWNGTSCSSGYDSLLANGEIFNPNFIALIKPFKTMRFMWWQESLYDSTTSWANRATPGWVFWDDTTKFSGAVPAEVQIALCNEVGADCWFNMPFLADDNYVTQFAALAHSSLNGGLKAYVEYGNEVWNNGAIAPNIWSSLVSLGRTAFPGAPNDFSAALFYGVLRAVQNGNAWKSVWGNDSGRVIRVLGGQNGYTARNQDLLNFPAGGMGGNPALYSGTAAQNVDAFATAPYFGYGVPDSFTLDQLFTEIFSGGLASGGYPGGMIKQVLDYATADYGVASAAGLPLLAYEGGQSLIDWTHADVTLQNLYASANRDSRMGTALTTLFNGWKSLGGHLFIHYSDIGVYSMWGYWGALEYLSQLSQGGTAKYAALTNFITNNPCWWSGCSSTIGLVLGDPVLGPILGSTTAPVSAPTPAPPSVAISSPTNGATIKKRGVHIVSSASDATGIKSITITGDSRVLKICSSTTSCSTSWEFSKGTHVIAATAVDKSGLQASTSVTILALSSARDD